VLVAAAPDDTIQLVFVATTSDVIVTVIDLSILVEQTTGV
jgi:hypothetical protein